MIKKVFGYRLWDVQGSRVDLEGGQYGYTQRQKRLGLRWGWQL